MSITGLPDGAPGGGPMRVGVAVVDLFTGLYTCVGILAALFRREKTGEGAHLDAALLDTQLAMLANQASNALISGRTRHDRAIRTPILCLINRSKRWISRSSLPSATIVNSQSFPPCAATRNGWVTSALRQMAHALRIAPKWCGW